ncbi:MAG: DUF4159 domain-containing protein [Alphaproteobacteria bacterium]|nr:DUF4159 domain-containing protein [Alphaproteobacteria bacterium]
MIGFSFLHPLILSALILLPGLWILLRVMPPAPRRIMLPTARFLEGLIPERHAAERTPWWILLLRTLIAALIITGLAGPVMNPAEPLPGTGPVRLVIDTSWPAAQSWEMQMKAAGDILTRAAQENRLVFVTETAPPPGAQKPLIQGPLDPGHAREILNTLAPRPWSADLQGLARLLEEAPPSGKIRTIWLSHGLDEGGAATLIQTLRTQGELELLVPSAESLPLLLINAPNSGVRVLASGPRQNPVTVQALAGNGQVLNQETRPLDSQTFSADFTFTRDAAIPEDIARFRIVGQQSAGAILLTGDDSQRRDVGIVGPGEEAEAKPFIEDLYYLRRALEPYATLHTGEPADLLSQDPSMIILPDTVALTPDTLNRLEKWVSKGGLLLRFAGPNTAAVTEPLPLIPSPLRGGGRAMDSALAGDKPVDLAPFPKESPFYGITLRDSITVSRQILPEAGAKTAIWATLEDGTPLITAAALENGLLVMVHTTASAAWSDLPLSGAYVDILKRLLKLSGHGGKTLDFGEGGTLDPLMILDGYGRSVSPRSTTRAIPAETFAETRPGPLHPPGLYGRASLREPLNVGDHIEDLKALKSTAGVNVHPYGSSTARPLMPYFLYAALILFLLDGMAAIALMGGFARLAACAILFFVPISPALAAESADGQYADGFTLAFFRSGNPETDSMAQHGLEALAGALKDRTSAEPAGVAALDPAADTLAFFPLIYWPLAPVSVSLSPKAVENIRHYLDHGGTLLIDTRTGSGEINPAALSHLLGALPIPPLEPIGPEHVLRRSFYLLDEFPGRFANGLVWAESSESAGRDGVSPLIIGSNDWAGGWSGERSGGYAGTERQREMALRFGINVVMYALTGNYKTDQVHVRALLDRIGR